MERPAVGPAVMPGQTSSRDIGQQRWRKRSRRDLRVHAGAQGSQAMRSGQKHKSTERLHSQEHRPRACRPGACKWAIPGVRCRARRRLLSWQSACPALAPSNASSIANSIARGGSWRKTNGIVRWPGGGDARPGAGASSGLLHLAHCRALRGHNRAPRRRPLRRAPVPDQSAAEDMASALRSAGQVVCSPT
jgi:hypothetical protein